MPSDQGFDEWYGIPRTTDEAFWSASVGYSPQIVPLEKIMEGKKGEKSRALKDYDVEQRRLIDAEITKRSVEFMERQAKTGKPFFMYVSLTQPHLPTEPNPAFKGKTGNGDWADMLAEMDRNVGQLLDAVDTLGIRDNTIVIFTSDNGPEFVKPWDGWAGPWRGAYFTALEGGIRVPFMIRWPGKVPAGRVSNEIVHGVDMFATLAKIAGAEVPNGRPMDSVDQSEFFLGKSEKSAHEGFPIWNSNTLMAVKWRNWKLHFYRQDTMFDPPVKLGIPLIVNLYTDPREEKPIMDTWGLTPMLKIVGGFEASTKEHPLIPMGTGRSSGSTSTSDAGVARAGRYPGRGHDVRCPDFHSLVLEGVYTRVSSSTPPRFHRTPPPTDADIAALLTRLHHRARRRLARRGRRPEDVQGGDPVAVQEPLLASTVSASRQGRVALGRRAGQPLRRLPAAAAAAPASPRCARLAGFSLHADVAVPAHRRDRLGGLYQPELAPGIGEVFGLGDIQQSLFLSPAKPGALIWGVGPIVQFPSATDDSLGQGKWGAGPTVVALTMQGPWVFGALVNNVWSFAGDDTRPDVNQMLIQPFVYNLPGGWYLTSSPIITANWEADKDDRWTVPIGGGVGKIHRFGKLPVNLQLAAYYNVVRPDAAAEWTLRFQVQLLFPK